MKTLEERAKEWAEKRFRLSGESSVEMTARIVDLRFAGEQGYLAGLKDGVVLPDKETVDAIIKCGWALEQLPTRERTIDPCTAVVKDILAVIKKLNGKEI